MTSSAAALAATRVLCAALLLLTVTAVNCYREYEYDELMKFNISQEAADEINRLIKSNGLKKGSQLDYSSLADTLRSAWEKRFPENTVAVFVYDPINGNHKHMYDICKGMYIMRHANWVNVAIGLGRKGVSDWELNRIKRNLELSGPFRIASEPIYKGAVPYYNAIKSRMNCSTGISFFGALDLGYEFNYKYSYTGRSLVVYEATYRHTNWIGRIMHYSQLLFALP